MIKKNLNDETELEWSKQTWQKMTASHDFI